MSGEAAPLVKTLEQSTEPVGTAGNDLNTDIGQAPFAGTVTEVTYTPLAAITGAATNNRTFNLVNKGQAGAGTTVIATLNFGNGTNASANDEKTIPLSGTAADLVVADGDVLQWQSVHIGTGITDPGGNVAVKVARTAGS